MRRIWKMMLLTVVMSLAVCLCGAFSVSAEKVSGEPAEGFFLGIGHRNRHLDVFRHIFFGIKSLKIPGIFGKRHLGRV